MVIRYEDCLIRRKTEQAWICIVDRTLIQHANRKCIIWTAINPHYTLLNRSRLEFQQLQCYEGQQRIIGPQKKVFIKESSESLEDSSC